MGLLAQTNAAIATPKFEIIGLLILVVIAMTGAILVLTHLIGPRRHGPVKDMPYESGVDPIGSARKRFNVRFYVVAMLFLLFDVEIVFFYPWAVLTPRFHEGPPLNAASAALSSADYAVAGYARYASVADMAGAGFGPGFLLAEMLVFVGILVVGYVYAWRKGAFEWN